jgi:hypothetical protein
MFRHFLQIFHIPNGVFSVDNKNPAPPSINRVNGRFDILTEVTYPDWNQAPNRSACFRILSISSGPVIPSGNLGKFSTSVVSSTVRLAACPQ